MARYFAIPDLASKIARLLVDHIGVHTEHCLTVGRSLLSKGICDSTSCLEFTSSIGVNLTGLFNSLTMLAKTMEQGRNDWNMYLPYVLCAY